MGNINVLYNLNKMKKKDRKKLVNGFFSMVPAFLGGYKPIDMVAAND